MRVLHVLDHSIPLHSGYTFRTAAILREQKSRGWETIHLTSPKQGVTESAVEDVDGLRFHRTAHRPRSEPVRRAWALMPAREARIDAVVRATQPQIIHAHSPVLNAIPAIRVGRRHSIPVVYEIRAFWEDAAVDHGTVMENGPRYHLTRAVESYAVGRAAHTFTICEGLRRDIVGRGVDESRVTVIPNAVDVEAFRRDRMIDPELAESLGISGAFVVGFIGSFYAYEGLDLLIRALPCMAASLPNVRLLLVGGGPQESALMALTRSLGMEGRVKFVGRVPHADVHRYYDLVDVLAYPRHSMRLTELVTPLKPLEAMAQGRLLVASDVGGHRELIRHDETGVLFRAGDVDALAQAVVKLAGASNDWDRLKTAARRFVEEERSWPASVARYAPVYERLRGRGKT